MSLPEKQAEIVGRYGGIEDRHERLAAITGRKPSQQTLPENARNDGLLVQGCVSRVWLQVEVVAGVLQIRFAAESALLQGLVGLLAELYEGAAVHEAAGFLPGLLEELELDRMLSATRWNGLAAVRQKIQRMAMEADVDRRS